MNQNHNEKRKNSMAAKAICITNQKGGVGNHDSRLAMKGKQVLLIDLDPQGQAAVSLGLKNQVRTGYSPPDKLRKSKRSYVSGYAKPAERTS
jgi:cellulose biosynthesis protein BcsQ